MHKLFISLCFAQGRLSTCAALKPSSLGKLYFVFLFLLQVTPWLACLSFIWAHSIGVQLFLEGNLLPPPPSPTSTWCWALCFMCHKLSCTRPIAFLAAYGGRVTDTICDQGTTVQLCLWTCTNCSCHSSLFKGTSAQQSMQVLFSFLFDYFFHVGTFH